MFVVSAVAVPAVQGWHFEIAVRRHSSVTLLQKTLVVVSTHLQPDYMEIGTVAVAVAVVAVVVAAAAAVVVVAGTVAAVGGSGAGRS